MKIICVSCNIPIYTFAGKRDGACRTFGAGDLRPLDGGDPPSGEGAMLCPRCGMKFYGQSLDGEACLFLGNNRWWPQPPLDQSC